MKNILVVQGGGRPNGNTAQLVDSFVKGAKEAGWAHRLPRYGDAPCRRVR